MTTIIIGKDAPLEQSIERFEKTLKEFGFNLEVSSRINPVSYVYSCHLRDKDAKMNFSNGKGASELASNASALGEYVERLSTNYFYSDYYLGKEISQASFVHYPNEKWFQLQELDHVMDFNQIIPEGMLDSEFRKHYVTPLNKIAEELTALEDDYDLNLFYNPWYDMQSYDQQRGVCALPFVNQQSKEVSYIPVSLISNIYASNGMSAGNSFVEAKVQALSEIIERVIKKKFLSQSDALPEIPASYLAQFPYIVSAIAELNKDEFSLTIHDASYGGVFPVVVALLYNRNNQTVYASFGAHPKFVVALERSVTELLQGRNLKELNDFSEPSFDLELVRSPENYEDHFIDSNGLIAWQSLSKIPSFPFTEWNVEGDTEQEYQYLLNLIREQYQAQIYEMEYSFLGSPAVRILVPGVSEIYTIDTFINKANCKLMPHYKLIEKLINHPTSLRELDHKVLEQLDDLAYYLDYDFSGYEPMRELLGLKVPADSIWQNLRVKDFLVLFFLSAGNIEMAKDHLEEIVDFNRSQHNSQSKQLFHLLDNLINLASPNYPTPEQLEANYATTLSYLYGDELLALAWQILDQNNNALAVLRAPQADLTSFEPHQQLIKSYQKLQQAKANHKD